MTGPAPSALYTEAIAEARRRGYQLSAAAQQNLIAAFRQAASQVEFDLAVSDNPLTQARAQALRQQLTGFSGISSRHTGTLTNTYVQRTVEDVVAIHEQVVAELFEQQQRQMSAAVSQALDRVNVRAVAVLAARNDVSGGAAGFQTLMRYHLQQVGPDLDRLIERVARGLSARRLTKDVADFLATGVADLDGYGLDPSGLPALPLSSPMPSKSCQ